MNLAAIAKTLRDALHLNRAAVAVTFAAEAPAGVNSVGHRAAAGCQFWQEGASRMFSTSQSDHELCSIGQYTHNLGFSPASEADLKDTLKVLGELSYVREEDLAQIAVLKDAPKHVIYGPLEDAPAVPDVVLLFVRADQQLILTEATQQVEGGLAPAMGRPACAVIPQAANTSRAALSLGCCGARAYLDALTPDIAIYAIPGEKLELYAERISVLARANEILTRFHGLRRRDIEAGKSPTIQESLAALQAAE